MAGINMGKQMNRQSIQNNKTRLGGNLCQAIHLGFSKEVYM